MPPAASRGGDEWGRSKDARQEIFFRWNPSAAAGRQYGQAAGRSDRNPRSMSMKRTLIRYKTKPEMAHENQRLIEGVFEELAAKSPDGVRYLVLRLDDGTFLHFVAVDAKHGASPIPAMKSFQLFQSGAKE